MQQKIILGSRGSDLALWQANFVLDQLKKLGVTAELKIIKTQGDNIQNLSFDKLEGKGFFTKEIEDALLAKEIDLAVHSHKDLPTLSPKGLIIAAVSEREDPAELILILKDAVNESLKFSFKRNAVVGTSSPRRKSQLRAFRDDVTIEDLRGNVPTRIQKLRDKKYDAIMLAAAGVERLNINLSEFYVEKISPREFVPAPAQGVLALQIREDDYNLYTLLQQLHKPEVAETIAIERKVLNLFEGGCQLPLGAYCEKEEDDDGQITYKTWVSKADSWDKFPKQFYFETAHPQTQPEKIVAKINALQPTSVFITRDFRTNDYFRKALTALGYTVNAKSLIELKPVPAAYIPKTDWVFFSSKNAVKHFFDQKPDVSGAKFGAVGKSTADELRKYNQRAEFIGYSTDTRLTGKQFSALVGNKTVLFPQAKGSLRSIQQQLVKPGQAIDLVVYETIKHNEGSLPDANVLVFTSPSNVDAYFEKYTVAAHQKVVAMGDATASSLRKKGARVHKMPITFDDLGLVQAVLGI